MTYVSNRTRRRVRKDRRGPRALWAATVCCALLLAACSSSRLVVGPGQETWRDRLPEADAELDYRVYLIGDAGGDEMAALDLLRTRLAGESENAAVVFLGDNLYPAGLPDSAAADRAFAERRLKRQLDAVTEFEGRVVFIPGNHDWNNSRRGGLEALRRQERFVEDYLNRGNTWLPDEGFPGPALVELTGDLKLVAIDTEWWLNRYERPFGDTGEYDLEEPMDFLVELDDLVRRNEDEDLLVVGHHPIFSAGDHAGYVPLKHHVFPLTALSPSLYVPLPIVGSLYPIWVRYFGGPQNLADPPYRALRRALLHIFESNPEVQLIYASGHDHSLQWFERGVSQHHIISGAGHEAEYVSASAGASFAARRIGFVRLSYYADGQIWMEVLSPEAEDESAVLFRSRLRDRVSERLDPAVPERTLDPIPADSTVIVSANPDYRAGRLKRFFLGSHNREAWSTPVEVPVLDLGSKHGGLTPVKRGGGMQTLSLRLEGADGRDYVLRSIDKDPTKTVPENLQGSLAVDLVQDQIAAIHPYGAFIIPRLARAAGIFHTNPELVFVPDDPRLGIYRDQFGGRLMMFEDRPDDDMSHEPSYGHAPDVISAHDLYGEIDGDNDHRVDQKAFVRARLFDVLLSDWDRHRDQWRWGAFEPDDGQGKIYRPIPRDRDWALNRMDGLLLTIYKQLDPRFQSFEEDYGYLRGFTINGGAQDRRFTNALTRDQWLEAAHAIQDALTDEVIAEAVNDWPLAIQDLDGEDVARILRTRRDRLDEVAAHLYAMYAEIVDVVGSNKHERFEVMRRADGGTEVVMWKTTKEGELRRRLYQRTFLPGETAEIRLYGQDGNDQFIVEGSGAEGMRVIAVGGAGSDTFTDRSSVAGLGRRTVFYDTKDGNEWDTGEETRTVRSRDPAVNAYDPASYAPDVWLPKPFFGYNRDDGVLLGGGVQLIRHGFRKYPHAASHTVRANAATRTRSVNLRYDALWVERAGLWDFGVEAGWLSPNSIRLFYGLGNETENTAADARYYESQLTQLLVHPFLQRRFGAGFDVRLGPRLEWVRVRDDSTRSIGQLPPQPGVSPSTFDNQLFAGMEAELLVEAIDGRLYPRRGIRFENAMAGYLGVTDDSDHHVILRSNVSVYLTPVGFDRFTLATRVGLRHNIGTFPFFNANALGQKYNLRGYRSTRFSGRTSFYQNVELRTRLFDFSSYAAVGRFGVFGFFDNGRVWTDGEDSTVWHQGYGGGVWSSFFDAFLISATVGFSKEDTNGVVKLGFLF